jgi:hypothetical protein
VKNSDLVKIKIHILFLFIFFQDLKNQEISFNFAIYKDHRKFSHSYESSEADLYIFGLDYANIFDYFEKKWNHSLVCSTLRGYTVGEISG